MYSDPHDALREPVRFASAAEQHAGIAFFDAAYRAEESGLTQAHGLADRTRPYDPELAECLVL